MVPNSSITARNMSRTASSEETSAWTGKARAPLALIVSAVVLLCGALVNLGKWSETDSYKIAWAGGAFIGAIGMFYRYLKFFKHYTTEVLTTYPEMKKDKPKEDPKPA